MNGVLRKRLLRDLRSGAGRYLALVLLITMGIYLVVSIVGAAETIIIGTEERKSVNMLEDGQFTVFLPLTDKELSALTEDGTVIEEHFSLDLKTEKGQTLRLFRNRKTTDLIQLDCGRLAESSGEAVMEKRFSEENGYGIGDKFSAGGTEFTVVGIGTVPDYDCPVASLSDSAVQSSIFGLLFVCDEQYAMIRDASGQNAEEYVYSYRLGKNTTDDSLKDKLKDIELDYTQVDNRFFRESIDEVLDERKKAEDALDDLRDGTQELRDGMRELDDNSADLRKGADDLFSAYLAQAQGAIASAGSRTVLTEENYADELDKLIKLTGSKELAALKDGLDGISRFRSGINDYTDGVKEAYDGSDELYSGVRDMRSDMDELIDELFDVDVDMLTSFTKAGDNMRIDGAANDLVLNRVSGLIAGVIVLMLFAYVISVFVVHQIERESGVIGSLYALGVRKNELLRHYVTLPAVIALIGGALGLVLSLTPLGVKMQMADSYCYFSLPVFDVRMPGYLYVYALVLPPLISIIVNLLVINKKLSRTALSLMRSEQKAASYRQFRVKSGSFMRVFRIRQLVRESRSALTVVLGLFISLLVVCLGLNTYTLCTDLQKRNVEDTRFEYMYLYKYPEKEAPADGEAAFIHGLSTDETGYTMEVSVIGLDGRSSYFDAYPQKGKNKAVINSSIAERLGYREGDRITLADSSEDTDYTFTITGIADYSPRFVLFMDIDSMRELFGREEDYYNAVYSDHELDIDPGRLYSVTTRDDVVRGADVFIDQMWSLIIVLIVASSIILCIVMYLMMGVMIDRSAFGISLMKVFGFRSREIRSLYINGNFFVVAIGALICIPAAKGVIDLIYPTMIANVACCMDTSYSPKLLVMLYCAIMLIYTAVSNLLVFRINRITSAEVLKNRE